MKNISIIILTLLLFVPPVQAHADAIIFNETVEAHIDALDDFHQDIHHENDTDEEKNKEHHHHCISLGISSAIILSDFSFEFIKPLRVKKEIHFYKTLNTSNFLDNLFQPPRI